MVNRRVVNIILFKFMTILLEVGSSTSSGCISGEFCCS